MTDPASTDFYADLAHWWPLFSPVADYREEAEFFAGILRTGPAPARTLLELGSGGGNNAFFLKRHFEMTLTDISPGMIEVSRALNPDCEHVVADMRTLHLGREFDRVFVHDAITYMTSEADLGRAIATAYRHCRPGGVALFMPDYLRELFSPGTEHGGADGDDGRALRYLEWVYDPDPSDTSYQVDYAFLLREADGSTRVAHDRHVEGLFPRDRWLQLLADAGFEARVAPFEHSELEPDSHELFICTRPTARP
jgi:SAM-dependent methyltransferase